MPPLANAERKAPRPSRIIEDGDRSYAVLQLVGAIEPSPHLDADTPPQFLMEFLAGRSPLTARRYLAALRQFSRWRERSLSAALDELLGVGEQEARRLAWRYRTALIDRRCAPSTINVALAALVAVARAARLAGAISWVLEVEPLRVQSYRDTRGPGASGIRALLDAAARRHDATLRARDLCALHMLFALGLRRAELVSLDMRNITRDENAKPVALWIRGKGRTADERLTLPAGVRRAITNWLAVRGDAPGPLLISLAARHRSSHQRLSGDGLAHVLRVLSASASLPRRATPHGIRHASISVALDRGVDLRNAAQFSRHRNLNTLVIYDDARNYIAGQVECQL
jgi:integrase/recombinase XerC